MLMVQFFDRTCFAEVWLRSTDAQGDPIGAIATYMSTVNQPWVPPMTGQDAINDLIVNKTVGFFRRSHVIWELVKFR